MDEDEVDVVTRNEEEGHMLEFLLHVAKEGHRGLVPLTEGSLKVSLPQGPLAVHQLEMLYIVFKVYL